jgi:hypothetical protein
MLCLILEKALSISRSAHQTGIENARLDINSTHKPTLGRCTAHARAKIRVLAKMVRNAG